MSLCSRSSIAPMRSPTSTLAGDFYIDGPVLHRHPARERGRIINRKSPLESEGSPLLLPAKIVKDQT